MPASGRHGRAGRAGRRTAAILGVVLWQIVLGVRRSPRSRRARGSSLERVLLATDPALGDPSAPRALASSRRTMEKDESRRLLVSSRACTSRGSSRARLHGTQVTGAAAGFATRNDSGALSIALLSCATVAVVMGPSRIVEGLDGAPSGSIARRSADELARVCAARGSAAELKTRETERAGSCSIAGRQAAERHRRHDSAARRGSPIARSSSSRTGRAKSAFADDGSGGARGALHLRAVERVLAGLPQRVPATCASTTKRRSGSTSCRDEQPTVEVEGAPKTLKLRGHGSPLTFGGSLRATTTGSGRSASCQCAPGCARSGVLLRSLRRRDEDRGRVTRSRPRDPERLRRMFLPISLTVRRLADNDPIDGPKWCHERRPSR